MTKKMTLSRITFISVGMFLALILIVPATTQKAHAAELDATTTSMLVNVISATQNLMNTIQVKINADAFTPAQSVALSATLGAIGNILVNISSMIGGIVLPNTGELPEFPLGAGVVN